MIYAHFQHGALFNQEDRFTPLSGEADMDEISKVVDRAIAVATRACKQSAADRAKALEYLREMSEILRSEAPDHPALATLERCIEAFSPGGASQAGHSDIPDESQ